MTSKFDEGVRRRIQCIFFSVKRAFNNSNKNFPEQPFTLTGVMVDEAGHLVCSESWGEPSFLLPTIFLFGDTFIWGCAASLGWGIVGPGERDWM